MSRLAPEFPVQSTYHAQDQSQQQPNRYMPPALPRSGLLALGLVALGLGALAWYYMGPDLRRYMKIEMM